MTEFEILLNEDYNDNPDVFPFNWERKYWEDKVTQWDEDKDDELDVPLFEGIVKKDRSRRERRKRDFAKALSKMKTDRAIRLFGHPRYDNLHEYSKNKIHCSCPFCAFNAKKHGRVISRSETHSDAMRRISSEDAIKDWYENPSSYESN